MFAVDQSRFFKGKQRNSSVQEEKYRVEKKLDELKEMRDQGKRKKPVSLSHVQDETTSVLKGKSYCFYVAASYIMYLS
jgi:hypothetical protein